MSQLSETLNSSNLLTLLSRSLPYYLGCWRDTDDTTGLFGSTDPSSYNMSATGSSSPVIEYVVRPHVQVMIILSAFMSTAEGTRYLAMFTTLEQARDRITRGVRWMTQTHLSGSRDVESFPGRHRWGENWRSSLWATQLALCGHLCKEWLDPGLMDEIRRVTAFEADRFVDTMPPGGCEVDTKVEENAIDTMLLAWALNTAPDHPHAPAWSRTLDIWAINVATTIEDRADHSEYAGRSVSHWVHAQTLYPDLTAENHGFFHPDILTYGSWIVLASSAYLLHGREIPGCLRRGAHQKAFDVLLRFCLPNGLLHAPGCQDMPAFVPRPFALAWGLWNNDPRALRITERLLGWMQAQFREDRAEEEPWVYGLSTGRDGWALQLQSLVGFELAVLAILPPPSAEMRFFSPGQIESAVDTRRIYPYIGLCYRRNTRTTRSVAWKALGQHPVAAIALHDAPELTLPVRSALLGLPRATPAVRRWEVLFHNDKFHRDGFDSAGRIEYAGENGERLLERDVRVVTWGDDGLLVLDEIRALTTLRFDEQYLSPVHVVNDCWSGGRVRLASGSLEETIEPMKPPCRPIMCPSYWVSINSALLVQLLWERTKGMVYVPSDQRTAPPYWNNCCVDRIAMHVDSVDAVPGQCVYRIGYFVGSGKGPRPFKCSGEPGPFFRGLVFMDSKSTLGLD